jgi:hypothetical protein
LTIGIENITSIKKSLPRVLIAASHPIPEDNQQCTIKTILHLFSVGTKQIKKSPGPTHNAAIGPLSVMKYEAPTVKIKKVINKKD